MSKRETLAPEWHVEIENHWTKPHDWTMTFVFEGTARTPIPQFQNGATTRNLRQEFMARTAIVASSREEALDLFYEQLLAGNMGSGEAQRRMRDHREAFAQS